MSASSAMRPGAGKIKTSKNLHEILMAGFGWRQIAFRGRLVSSLSVYRFAVDLTQFFDN